MKMARWSFKKSPHISVRYASKSLLSLVMTKRDLSAARRAAIGIHVRSVVVANTVDGYGG